MEYNRKEVPAELYFNLDDLERIRKVYTKKPPHVGKGSAHETTNLATDSAKRNIQRVNSAGKMGKKAGQKKLTHAELVDEATGSDYVVVDKHDPNYYSEDESNEDDLIKMLYTPATPMKDYEPNMGGVTALVQDYKKELEHIIVEHYLKTLEVSPQEIVHVYFNECNGKYEEKLRELEATAGEPVGVTTLPYYEVIKRSIIKSFDYANFTINTDTTMPSIVGGGASRMEAISLLLVALCDSKDFPYDQYMEAGFDRIFEIINELNLDVPNVNTLLSCYLTRCVVDEIICPKYISSTLNRHSDELVDGAFDEDDEDSPPGDSNYPPAPPSVSVGMDSPTATAKILKKLQYTNHSLSDIGMQMALYRKEMNAHVTEVITKSKVLLSHPHYSTKLQHIWGIGLDEAEDESQGQGSPTSSSSTRELKHHIDDVLLEYLDNCQSFRVRSGSVSSATGEVVQVDEPLPYNPPSQSLLSTTYTNLKELGDHTLGYYAHEIVKRGISMVLLNYRCNHSTKSDGDGSLQVCTQRYMSENPSAQHVCNHLVLLLHYCMCGEDVDTEPQCASAAVSECVHIASTLTPLPPPIISKSQYYAGLSKFFDRIVEPAPVSPGSKPTAVNCSGSLFYDVMLDAPFAPYLFYQLLQLSTHRLGGLKLLEGDKVDHLLTFLAPFHKK